MSQYLKKYMFSAPGMAVLEGKECFKIWRPSFESNSSEATVVKAFTQLPELELAASLQKTLFGDQRRPAATSREALMPRSGRGKGLWPPRKRPWLLVASSSGRERRHGPRTSGSSKISGIVTLKKLSAWRDKNRRMIGWGSAGEANQAADQEDSHNKQQRVASALWTEAGYDA